MKCLTNKVAGWHERRPHIASRRLRVVLSVIGNEPSLAAHSIRGTIFCFDHRHFFPTAPLYLMAVPRSAYSSYV
jgi:hypothetical protein